MTVEFLNVLKTTINGPPEYNLQQSLRVYTTIHRLLEEEATKKAGLSLPEGFEDRFGTHAVQFMGNYYGLAPFILTQPTDPENILPSASTGNKNVKRYIPPAVLHLLNESLLESWVDHGRSFGPFSAKITLEALATLKSISP